MTKKTTILTVALALIATTASVSATPPPPTYNVPDLGSSGMLLGSAMFALAGLRMAFRKNR